MNFSEAFELMKLGKNLRRKVSHIRISAIGRPEFVDHNLRTVTLLPIDFSSNDWEVVE